ncbi:MAG: DUF262 domain-containing protein [Candidatus Electrothrix sp. AW5]|nr:DUF262 domain-containing protein [Candidatus Electrothrix gigas]
METQKPLLEGLLNKQIRYVVPVFQRHYVWTEEYQWKPLWEDIQEKINARINKNKIHTHYTGSIVLNQEIVTTDILSTYCVIDGQQRFTTFQLFLIAFREVCRKIDDDQVLINNINKYIFNEQSYGIDNFEDQKYKLVPTKFDVKIFNDIADSTYDELHKKRLKPILNEYGFGPRTYIAEAKRRSAIMGAYLYFFDEITEFLKNNESGLKLQELIKNILISITRDFQFVEIGLSPNDDPQMIFETLNGRGASLTETDLIRNYIFMRADAQGKNMNTIYEKYWDEYDDPNSEYKWHGVMKRGRFNESRLQFFLIDYLILKTKEDIRYDQVFYRYKSYIVNNEPFQTSEDELKELYKYSKIFKLITKPTGNTPLENLANRLLVMDITTIFPLLLFIEGEDEISTEGKEKIYTFLDSYLTRRFICGSTTKNYNNVFLDLLKNISKNKNSDDFVEYLKSKSADSNIWPDDSTLKDKVLNRPIYKEEKGKARVIINIFLEVESHIRTLKQETINISPENLTIEHVMPQNWFEHWPLNEKSVSQDDFELSYQKSFAEEDENGLYHQIENRKNSLNTMGNLTLLTSSLNPSVSNGPYGEKQPEIIKQSSLKLNSYFQDCKIWDEKRIKTRGEKLFIHIKMLWVYPASE